MQELSNINWPKYKLVEAFRMIFSQHPKYTWDISEDRTKIHIRGKNASKLTNTDDRPIISISRGQIRSQNRVMSNIYKTNNKTGAYEYVDILDTMITVNCISRYGLVAEEIASIVYGTVKFNKSPIMSLGFINIDPPIIGEEQVITSDSDSQLISVSVVFNISYVLYWVRTPEALLLGDITYRVKNLNDTTL